MATSFYGLILETVPYRILALGRDFGKLFLGDIDKNGAR